MKFTLLLVLVSLFSHFAIAGDGTIKGVVIDQKFSETLPDATVRVSETSYGARTDMDGQFVITLPAGTYDLEVSFIGFASVQVEDVVVTEGQETTVADIFLGETQEKVITDVVVTAQASRKSENALLSIKKNSTNFIDGVTSDNFRKMGDGDAAASIKRVPGVSIESGKYVYVRGLGDRYTKTTLNGMDIPGLDPDRNSLQMDLFPTSVMDNIIVNKTFLAELPADFTGGVVDLGLKSLPEYKSLQISASMGYNPNMHFNKNYLYYQGSKTDFLGFDDGQRAIPAVNNIPSFIDALGDPSGVQAKRYAEILHGFDPHMSALQRTNGMDYGFSASFGNRIEKAENNITGYNFLVNYKRNIRFYQDVEYGRYGLESDPDINEMELRERQTGSYGEEEVLLTVMGGYGIQKAKSKYNFNLLNIQNGNSKAGIFQYYKSNQGTDFEGFQHNLEYSQRRLTNFIASGEHHLSDDWKLDWKVSPTSSSMQDPDIRFTRYVNRGGSPVIGTEGGLPQRIWRNLDELDINSQFNLQKSSTLFGKEAKFKMGAAYTYKTRDFKLRSFYINPKPSSTSIDLTGNPDELFFDENLWPAESSTRGVIYQALFAPTNPNQYNSNVNNIAAYGSSEMMLSPKLKTILGLRIENFVQRYTGRNQLGTKVLKNDVVLNNLGLYPSLNMVYASNEKTNLRFSASRTVARPSMKELSYAEIYDPLTGRTFIGGLFEDTDGNGTVYWDGNLKSTNITNLDLRWETFPGVGNTIALGAFYKFLTNPIEIIQSSKQAGAFQPRNVGDGQVLGAELEYKHSLEFLAPQWKALSFNLNATYTYSQIKYSKTEKESRENNKRTGQVIGEGRQMAGQAPYMINAGLQYSGAQKGWAQGLEAGLYYNMQGPTLVYVGIVDRPDIYSVPFHSLNLNLNKSFGMDKKYRLGLSMDNILGDWREQEFKSFQSENQIFTRYNPGRLMKLNFSYTIR